MLKGEQRFQRFQAVVIAVVVMGIHNKAIKGSVKLTFSHCQSITCAVTAVRSLVRNQF